MPRYVNRAPPAHLVEIQLDQPKTTFTTGDRIHGNVQVTPGSDIHFGNLEILFLGTSRSNVQRITPVARDAQNNQTFHIFLRLSQPDVHVRFPNNNILRAGETYTFPYVFVVPDQLLTRSCRHYVVDEAVREAHSQLPPTFGDNDLMRQLDLPDDLAPVNASIRYGVYARLTKEEKDQDDETRSVTLMSRSQRVRILPGSQFQLSPSIDAVDGYRVRQERVIRNKRYIKTGAIVVEIQRPQSFRLAPPNALRRDSVSSKASIALRFDPTDKNALPPQLGNLAIVLKTHTYYASKKQEVVPTQKSVSEDMGQAMHIHQHVLSRRSMAGVEWMKKGSSQPPQVGVPGASKAYKGDVYYSAQILVPISLPPDATFVPTFHSCLISRVYELEMRLKVQEGGVWGRAVQLTMPAHVSTEREGRRPTYSEATQRRESDRNSTDDECAALPPRHNRRQDSVINYGHFGVRLDELPAYTQ